MSILPQRSRLKIIFSFFFFFSKFLLTGSKYLDYMIAVYRVCVIVHNRSCELL